MDWGPEGASTERGAGRAMRASALATVLATYSGWSDEEARDLDRVRALTALAGSGGDPWARSSPLHVTGSAGVVHPPRRPGLARAHGPPQGRGGRGEPAHEHADLRYVLATSHPDDAAPESPEAALRWLSFDEALQAAGEDNLRITIERINTTLAAA